MTLEVPSRDEIARGTSDDLRAETNGQLNPSTLERSFITGMTVSLSNALSDWYSTAAQFLQRELHPQTASLPFLLQGWWTRITGIVRKSASRGTGLVTFTGTEGAQVPLALVLDVSGQSYRTTSSAAIGAITGSSLSITSTSDGLVTFRAVNPHELASGIEVTISGATDTGMNGTFAVSVIDDYVFTFTADLVSPGAAGDSAIFQALAATVAVESDASGKGVAQIGGATASIASAPIGLGATAYVGWEGIADGEEIEGKEPLRERILDALAIDYGVFTAAEIRSLLLGQKGVTRVWVVEAELNPVAGHPAEGQVLIAFMLDGRENPFPTGLDIETQKAFISQNYRPANTADVDVWVQSPTPLVTDFSITGLSPATQSMRNAVEKSLRTLIDVNGNYETAIKRFDYICAIRDAVDPDTGQRPTDFEVTLPTGDIIPAVNELPRLGNITW